MDVKGDVLGQSTESRFDLFCLSHRHTATLKKIVYELPTTKQRLPFLTDRQTDRQTDRGCCFFTCMTFCRNAAVEGMQGLTELSVKYWTL